MTVPGFLILAAVAIIGALIVIELAQLPGRIARDRGHPQADAINALGWLGLVTAGPGWVVAMVWAFTRPGPLVAAEAVQPPEAVKSEAKPDASQ